MRREIQAKLKQNKAYTLPELLITLAIIVVLMGVSMLAISNWVSRFKMMEVDGYAKSIYFELQNQLATKEVEGTLSDLVISDDRYLTTAPHDYDVDNKGDAWKQLCYVQKQDDTTKMLIPAQSSTYQISGDYIVELNPSLGEVYGVFYWEKDEPMTYELLQSLTDRTIESRERLKIGYYGGEADKEDLGNGVSLGQTVELINEEELYLKVMFERSGVILQGHSSMSIDLTVSDKHGNTWYKKIDDATRVQEADGVAYYILLDSMQDGLNFKDITEEALVPGDDIEIIVRSEFLKGFYHCIETTAVKGNSLFDTKTTENDATTIKVSSVRHFRNLNDVYYTHENANEAIKIVQANDIDFDAKKYAWEGKTYKGKGEGAKAITEIAPLKNDAIFMNAGGTDSAEYNGQGFIIKNFKITTTQENAGLFATAKNVVFKNVKIEDTLVSANGSNNVGGLVGSIEGGQVIDCGIYLKNYIGEENDKKYCVHQSALDSHTYDNRMDEKVATMFVSGTNNVGGLIGNANGTNIENSFAAVNVKGTENVGGLVGKAENIEAITKCYATGDVKANNNVGGFIGDANKVKSVTNATSSGDVYGQTNVGGFLGSTTAAPLNKSKYEQCISYGRVLDKTKNEAPTSGKCGAFVYKNASSYANYKNCRYLTQKLYNDLGYTDPGSGIAKAEYNELTAQADQMLAVNMSFAYDDALVTEVYPFVPVLDSHYGDWPMQNLFNNSLIYYEKYSDDSYGYYCVATIDDGSEGQKEYTWVLDTLKDKTCIEDGYALISTYNLTKFTYLLKDGSGTTSGTTKTVSVAKETDADSDQNTVFLRQLGGVNFKGYKNGVEMDKIRVTGMHLYLLPYDLQCPNRSNAKNFYDNLVLYAGYAKGNDGVGAAPVLGGATVEEGISYLYNPHFAKTAINPGVIETSATPLSNPSTAYVRSARQLNALGKNSYYWKKDNGKINFLQETDIDFSTYTKTYYKKELSLKNQPIGTDTTPFKNNYNGQCNTIKDYSVNSNNRFVGLFGEVRGTKLENIVMIAEEGKGSISCGYTANKEGVGVGALVGMAHREGSENLIQNCSASGYQITFTGDDKDVKRIAIGGLAGFSTIDVKNCSAVNEIIIPKYNEKQDDRVTFVAGLIGSSYSGKLENSYAGGSIEIKKSEKNVGFINVAGVTAGAMELSGYSADIKDTVYRNLYSYTNVTPQTAIDNYKQYILSSPVATIYSKSGQSYSKLVNSSSNITKENCYYLKDTITPVKYTDKGKKSDNGYNFGTLTKYSELKTFAKNGVIGGKVDFTYSSDGSSMLKQYPFPAVVSNEKGKLVHYGAWPTDPGDEPEEPKEDPKPDPDPDPDPDPKPGDKELVPDAEGIINVGLKDDDYKQVALYRGKEYDEANNLYDITYEFDFTLEQEYFDRTKGGKDDDGNSYLLWIDARLLGFLSDSGHNNGYDQIQLEKIHVTEYGDNFIKGTSGFRSYGIVGDTLEFEEKDRKEIPFRIEPGKTYTCQIYGLKGDETGQLLSAEWHKSWFKETGTGITFIIKEKESTQVVTEE